MRNRDSRAQWNLGTRLVITCIRVYQYTLSPLLQILFGPYGKCRFTPSCSQYGKEAFERYGFFKGIYLTTWRILRCHPFAKDGYDPLPKSFNLRQPLSAQDPDNSQL